MIKEKIMTREKREEIRLSILLNTHIKYDMTDCGDIIDEDSKILDIDDIETIIDEIVEIIEEKE